MLRDYGTRELRNDELGGSRGDANYIDIVAGWASIG